MNVAKPGRAELSRLSFEAEVARRLRASAVDAECRIVSAISEALLPAVAAVGQRRHLLTADGFRREEFIRVVTVHRDDEARLVLDETGGWLVESDAPDDVVRRGDRVSIRYVVDRFGGTKVLRSLFKVLIALIEDQVPDDYDDLIELVVVVQESFLWCGVS